MNNTTTIIDGEMRVSGIPLSKFTVAGLLGLNDTWVNEYNMIDKQLVRMKESHYNAASMVRAVNYELNRRGA